MPFAYVSGDPNNLVGGDSAAMSDIQGPFFDIAAYLNSTAIADLAKGLLVIGELRWMAVATGPAGWLKCDGTAYSRTTYSALFSALGGASSPYGLGDGVNTFNVPDLRGRTTMGTGQGDPISGVAMTNRVAGQKVGEEKHVLAATESGVPAHAHTAGSLQTVALVQPRVGGLIGNNFNNYAGNPGYNAVDGWDNGAARGVTGSTANATAASAAQGHATVAPALVIPAYIYAGT